MAGSSTSPWPEAHNASIKAFLDRLDHRPSHVLGPESAKRTHGVLQTTAPVISPPSTAYDSSRLSKERSENQIVTQETEQSTVFKESSLVLPNEHLSTPATPSARIRPADSNPVSSQSPQDIILDPQSRAESPEMRPKKNWFGGGMESSGERRPSRAELRMINQEAIDRRIAMNEERKRIASSELIEAQDVNEEQSNNTINEKIENHHPKGLEHGNAPFNESEHSPTEENTKSSINEHVHTKMSDAGRAPSMPKQSVPLKDVSNDQDIASTLKLPVLGAQDIGKTVGGGTQQKIPNSANTPASPTPSLYGKAPSAPRAMRTGENAPATGKPGPPSHKDGAEFTRSIFGDPSVFPPGTMASYPPARGPVTSSKQANLPAGHRAGPLRGGVHSQNRPQPAESRPISQGFPLGDARNYLGTNNRSQSSSTPFSRPSTQEHVPSQPGANWRSDSSAQLKGAKAASQSPLQTLGQRSFSQPSSFVNSKDQSYDANLMAGRNAFGQKSYKSSGGEKGPGSNFSPVVEAFANMNLENSGSVRPGIGSGIGEQKEQLYFDKYPTAAPRTQGPAKIRRVILKGIPENWSPRDIAAMVWGGPIEKIIHSKGSATASVLFVSPQDCHQYHEDTANHIERNNYLIEINRADQVDPLVGLASEQVTKGATRCVRAVGVEQKWTAMELQKLAEGEGKVRKLEDSKVRQLNSGHREFEARFCDIADAVKFRSQLLNDPEWEMCNIQYAKDPCAEAHGVH